MTDDRLPPHLEADDRFWTIGRSLSIAAVVALTVAWIWVFLFAPRGHPDRLEDRAFPEAAEAICAQAREDVLALPRAFEADDFAARADVLDEATARLATMIDDLDDIAPPVVDEDTTNISTWLDDWRTYLRDRETYAALLRVDEDPAFTVTDKGGVQVTEYIDGFADANDMESCQIPLDV